MFPRKRLAPLVGLLLVLWLAPVCKANTIFNVEVQTGSLNSTNGWFDIQFNPGAISWQDAYVDVRAFTTDGALLSSLSPLSPAGTAGVSGGPLPTPITIRNTEAFNDYFQNITFGDVIQFTLTFYGPAIDAPDPNVFSGSAFSFALYGDDQATPLLGASPLFEVDIEVGGAVSASNFAPKVVTIQAAPSNIPEPSTLWFCGFPLAIIGLRFIRPTN
jgi:hypothetical protein